jgi:hypothetical protein
MLECVITVVKSIMILVKTLCHRNIYINNSKVKTIEDVKKIVCEVSPDFWSRDLLIVSNGSQCLDEDNVKIDKGFYHCITSSKCSTIVSIVVKDMGTKKLSHVQMELSTPISELKRKVYQHHVVNIAPHQQRCILHSRVMKDYHVLGDYLIGCTRTPVVFISQCLNTDIEITVSVRTPGLFSTQVHIKLGDPLGSILPLLLPSILPAHIWQQCVLLDDTHSIISPHRALFEHNKNISNINTFNITLILPWYQYNYLKTKMSSSNNISDNNAMRTAIAIDISDVEQNSHPSLASPSLCHLRTNRAMKQVLDQSDPQPRRRIMKVDPNRYRAFPGKRYRGIGIGGGGIGKERRRNGIIQLKRTTIRDDEIGALVWSGIE